MYRDTHIEKYTLFPTLVFSISLLPSFASRGLVFASPGHRPEIRLTSSREKRSAGNFENSPWFVRASSIRIQPRNTLVHVVELPSHGSSREETTFALLKNRRCIATSRSRNEDRVLRIRVPRYESSRTHRSLLDAARNKFRKRPFSSPGHVSFIFFFFFFPATNCSTFLRLDASTYGANHASWSCFQRLS